MGHLSREQTEDRVRAERAAEWLQRLESGAAREQAAFMAWLKESPLNVREVLLMTTWDKVLESFDPQHRVEIVLDQPAQVLPLGQPASPPPRTKRPMLRWAAAFAAVVVCAAAAGWLWTAGEQTYETAVGEQRSVELSDGSVIHLNARSKVRVAYSNEAREVDLLEGQALFKVERDAARPFQVRADRTSIRALGTQFDVHRRADRTTVSVLEGKVEVRDDRNTRTLSAGEEASVAPDGRISNNNKIDVAATTAWRQRRLVFRKDTLADMAAEFNRYNHKPHIVIEGEALRSRPFNGVFDADDPGSLIQFLNGVGDLAVVTNDDEVIVRAR